MADFTTAIATGIQGGRRRRIQFFVGFLILLLVGLTLYGTVLPESAYAVDYAQKNLGPSLVHPFGTDHMGRDMFMRSLKGLSISLRVGLLAAFISSCIALILGTLSATFGGKVDKFVIWLVDLCMGIPHILLILMISVMLGGGIKGVVIGVVVTHWPRLTRVIRAEVMQLRTQPYVFTARGYGQSSYAIARQHFAPHVFPQYIIGLVLLFPHAIMHEAAISFLGYGLPLDLPAIGIILSESMRYLATGAWWLAFFPGALLLVVVLIFERLGDLLQAIIDPLRAYE
ncbi:MAG: ABC transporter permease [Succiniclasticum sp.]|nr:ABC transporter permease [Succiniclasticum sp.]